MVEVYEEKVVKAIQEGSIVELKKCWISKSDVNRPLSFSREYIVKNNSNIYPFPRIKNPTLVVYSILCEQPEILLYLCETKSPNLLQKVNGWAPIHYAACTASPECMRVLLKFQVIQESIDFPVTEPMKIKEGRATTALHIAVTNRRHAQALMLTQDLPEIEYNGELKKITKSELKYKSANVTQMSAFGSLPIHIAVRQNDVELCRILMSVNDDLTLTNDKGKTPLDIANEYRKKEAKCFLESIDVIDVSDLIDKYIKKSEPEKEQIPDEEEETEYEEAHHTTAEYREMQETITQMSQTIDMLSKRIADLERRTPIYVPATKTVTKIVSPCKICGSTKTKTCKICGFSFCATCMRKPKHTCNK